MTTKIEENIYINLIINDNSLDENISGNNKMNYLNNLLILEKDNEYYFKYYPGQYEPIINYIPIYSNKFLEKQYFIKNEQNISINYNIESISDNSTFGLFFDINEFINIKGYFSKTIDENTYQKNIDDYILNINNKYFNLIKSNDEFKYFNLDINVESQFLSELIIYEIQEIIVINKIDSIYKINKTKNYIFLLDETVRINYSKFETYTLISLNNENNIIKLIPVNGKIKTSRNYLITKLNDIKAIFIKTNEEDIFAIKLITEEVSKYLNEESNSNSVNTLINDKKYGIDFIHSDEEVYIFYNSLSGNLKIKEIDNGRFFLTDEFLKNKFNYSLLFGPKYLEEKKTHMILMESSNPFLYQKYIKK